MKYFCHKGKLRGFERIFPQEMFTARRQKNAPAAYFMPGSEFSFNIT